MNIAIRVDASAKIGLGHWMRCQALKNILQQNGCQVTFFVGQAASGIIDEAENAVVWLERPMDTAHVMAAIAAAGTVFDWLVIDHYLLDQQFETQMRQQVPSIMVIDDLANRRHDCDVLLDQNFYLQPEKRYLGLIPAETKLFLGPQHALLRQQFFTSRNSLRLRPNKVEKVLINFGGSDPAGMTLKVVAGLQQQADLTVYCVAGQANPRQQEISQFCMQSPNVVYFPHVDNMAELMAQVDLAIGAGGSSHWERMFLGLPAIVVAVAENQIESSRDLAQVGAITYLGTSDTVQIEVVLQAVANVRTRPDLLTEMKNKGRQIMGDATQNRYDELIQWMRRSKKDE